MISGKIFMWTECSISAFITCFYSLLLPCLPIRENYDGRMTLWKCAIRWRTMKTSQLGASMHGVKGSRGSLLGCPSPIYSPQIDCSFVQPLESPSSVLKVLGRNLCHPAVFAACPPVLHGCIARSYFVIQTVRKAEIPLRHTVPKYLFLPGHITSDIVLNPYQYPPNLDPSPNCPQSQESCQCEP